MEDLANILSYEIKEDLAKRYFGCRKQIENDKFVYLSSLTDASTKGKQEILHSITTIYTLLGSAELCSVFFKFTGLPQDFLDSPLQPHDVAISKRLIFQFKRRGFTRKKRYRNTLYHLYSLLEQKVAAYRKEFSEGQLFYEEICDEIKKFQRNFDLTSIFQFLREIDDPDRGHGAALGYQTQTTERGRAETSMEIQFPEPPQSILRPIEPIPPLETAASQLHDFAEKGYAYTYARKNQGKRSL